ncbi:NAD(P)-dependent oxidoreductase [Actinomadura litoris]|uniref:NAD(P)H-binding protein n=1 Tax=Actinomadura litoris TaxID=2678616 RepID=A0A7K1L246_9ACTN|nr:NAD(P)H-binding protein [Actinomadura litoris]MUN38457.1 NAD(P)H-binding protein [Actinomadura litoris]
MRLTVFGATGGIGGPFVRQALDAGHEVTAVVRGDPAALIDEMRERAGRFIAVRADVMDPVGVEPHISGRDAVVSVLGSPGRGPSTVRVEGARSVTAAMGKADVRRLVIVSTSAAFTEVKDDPFARLVVKPLVRRILKHPFADARGMERVVRESDLDWTIVRSPRLTGGGLTRDYRMGVDGGLRGAYRISRADLADCLIGIIDDPDFHRATVSPGY